MLKRETWCFFSGGGVFPHNGGLSAFPGRKRREQFAVRTAFGALKKKEKLVHKIKKRFVKSGSGVQDRGKIRKTIGNESTAVQAREKKTNRVPRRPHTRERTVAQEGAKTTSKKGLLAQSM